MIKHAFIMYINNKFGNIEETKTFDTARKLFKKTISIDLDLC